MGIVMRSYVFICVVGIMSTVCIVLVTFSNKNSHRIQMSEGDKRAVLQQRRKPEIQKIHRDITNSNDGTDLMPSKQLEKNIDDEDRILIVKLFSDTDHRTNRNTASVKNNMEDDTFSVLEDSNLRPHLQVDYSDSNQTSPDVAALLMNNNDENYERLTSLETVSPGEKSMSTERLVIKDKMEAEDRPVTKNHKTVRREEEKLVPFNKLVSSATLSTKNKEAQNNRMRHLAIKKAEVKTLSRMELDSHKTQTKNLRDAEKHHHHRPQSPVPNKRVALPNRSRTVEKSPSDRATELAFRMTPQLRIRPVVINQNILKQTNATYPVYIKSNATLTRVLAVGNLKTGKCKPQNDLAMIKTHKCSSSTLQNILYRWGDDHNLTFVLPKDGPYIGHPQPFDLSLAQRVVGDKYNILANHARYNQQGLRKAMPSDTLYFTVLRDPVKQFESAFTYYKFDERYGVPGLRSFLKQPEIYFQREPVYPRQAGRNQMLYDLGLDARFMDDTSTEVREYIAMIENNFQLVMIAEHFEESLILLKDLLCWSMDDIVYFNQNARSQSSVRRVTLSMRREILDWNAADTSMYNHFNQTLWEKIKNYGIRRMREEVGQLQLRNEILKKKCIGGKLESHDPRMWYPPGIKVDSFVVNPNATGERLCEQLIRPELSYINILKAKQQAITGRPDRRDELLRRHSQMREHHSRRFVNFRPERIK